MSSTSGGIQGQQGASLSEARMDVKVCLIYWEGFNERWSYTKQSYPPLGTMYVAATLKSSVRKVSLVDAVTSRYTADDILEFLAKEKPHYIGFTIYINQVKSSVKLARMIKELLPDTKIIFGGPHIFFHHKQVMADCYDVDYCIRGEGEYPTLSLIKALYHDKTLERIPGLTYRTNDEIRVNPDPVINTDLDNLPFPARELSPYENYRSTEAMGRKKYFTTMVASRGCPHNCTYCDSAARWNRKINFRTPENVVQELMEVQEKFGVKYIRFIDDYFTARKKWVRRFCELIEQKNIKIKWQCSCRIESIDRETIQLMKKAGCQVIALGIEFGNEEIRKLVRKNFSNNQVRNAVEIIKDARITIYGLFMLGYPTETESTINETIELAVSLDLDMAGFAIVTPYPGTDLYKYCEENKLLKTHDLDKYGTALEPVFTHDNLTSEQLLNLQKYARKRFYMRPKLFLKRLKKLDIHDPYRLYSFLISSVKARRH